MGQFEEDRATEPEEFDPAGRCSLSQKTIGFVATFQDQSGCLLAGGKGTLGESG